MLVIPLYNMIRTLDHRFLPPAAASLLIALLAAASPAVAQVNILSQHNDNNRSGANLSETILTTSNVNVNSFGKLYSYSVSGDVFAQPLYVSSLSIQGGTHNVLYVATMNDVVYAFDADSNSQLWSKTLPVSPEKPVPITGIVGSNTLNIHNNVGIEGTPVIDLGTNTMYLVARTINGSTYYQRLHALDILTGAEKFGGPVTISASVSGTGNGSSGGTLAFDPKMENQRPGLALANGEVIITWAGHEDKNPWHGWVIAYNAATLAQVGHFCVTPDAFGGGIWNAGQAPAVDASGNVYVMTGNGDYNPSSGDYGDSFLKFSTNSGLTLADWFTPDNAGSGSNTGDNPTNEDAHDLDLGSAGAMLVPGTTDVFGGGKLGVLYLVDTNNMGHEVSGDTQIIQNFQGVKVNSTCGYNHIHGAPVYWNGAKNGPTIYVWGENDSGKAYKLVSGTFQTTASSHTAATSPTTGCGMPGGILSLSANGNATGTGIVWASTVNTGNAVHNNVNSILRALNADDLSSELWNSNMNSSRDSSGTLAKYVPPTIANGKVYMPTWNQDISGSSNTINVYGLLNVVPQVAAPSFSPGGGTYTNAQNVTISDTTSGAIIRYTTNGSTPSETNGTVYISGSPVSIGSTATLKAIAYESGLTDSTVTSATYTISSGGSGTPITLEAENMSPVGTGATVSTSSDPNASGGVLEFLNSTGAGQTMTLTTPAIAAGTYQVQFRYKTNTTRGQHTITIDGSPIGGTIDQYATTAAYQTVTLGTETFGADGTHSIVLTVTGKNTASTQYYVTADSFILTPQSSEQQVAAPSFSPGGGTYTSAQNVTISDATSGATIRYTTDGSPPSDTNGTIYSNTAVSIGVTTNLQAIASESGMTDSAITNETYTISTGGGSTFNFEAASMSPVGTGATVSTSSDTNVTGGLLEFLNSTAASQSMTLTTPSMPAGTYQVQFRYKTNTTRGQHNVVIDGTQVGGTIDQYATTSSYPTATLGTVTFASAGTHTIVLTVTGKDTAATQYYITADKFTFTEQ
jgi:hypothetical protein